VQLGGASEKLPRWWQPAGRMAASRSRQSRPLQPEVPPRCRRWLPAVQQASREAPHARAWPHERAHAPPRAAPPALPCPGTHGQHHLHGRITPACQPPGVTRRHRTCSLAHQPGSTSTVAPHGDADRPWARGRRSTVNHWSWQAPRPSGIAPDAAHHRKPCLSALCQIPDRAPPALVRMHRHAEILGRISGNCCRVAGHGTTRVQGSGVGSRERDG
jgi:hypothetical protein